MILSDSEEEETYLNQLSIAQTILVKDNVVVVDQVLSEEDIKFLLFSRMDYKQIRPGLRQKNFLWPGLVGVSHQIRSTGAARNKFNKNVQHFLDVGLISGRGGKQGSLTKMDAGLRDGFKEAIVASRPALAAKFNSIIATVLASLPASKQKRCKNQSWHAMFTFPHSELQDWHVDDDKSAKRNCYFTLIFPLTKDLKYALGGTQLKKGVNLVDTQGQVAFIVPETVLSKRGSATIFNGAVEHRGQANASSDKTRIFLYIVLFGGKQDLNA